MPYTPPSAQSPASSKSSSPVVSRTSSYHQDDVPRSPSTMRPQPPRSMSSASYLHKHRRSPSIGKSEAPLTPTDAADSKVDTNDFARRGSLRQSPPPVNNLRIPTGVVISPPDSSENSDGDESVRGERGRELQQNWHQLQEAVRSLPQQREHSPEKGSVGIPQSASMPVSQTTSPTALSASARKISHSRSSTETRIMHKPSFVESPSHTSDDSDEDDVARFKPSLVRKKSGELVKPALRPSSRRRYSSMPGTPTYSKSVHFNDNDNQTRHFLQVDKPIAVSAGSSPVESYDSESEFPFHEDMGKPELQIKVANLTDDDFSRKTKPVRVERIFLSSDRSTLVGVCAAQNISFQKLVVARFTLDYWKTTSEVVAEFNNDPRSQVNDGCDRFIFHIKLSDQANIDNKTLLLCVRYNVGGQEYWDNNEGTNYQIDFSKAVTRAAKPNRPVQSSPLGQRPLSAIPRSRHTPPSSRGGRPQSADDDFASRFDSSSAYSFGSAAKLLDEQSTSIKLRPKSKRASILSAAPPSQPTNGLGSRYDFGTSLSAALTTAQDHLGRRSGLVNGAVTKAHSNGSYFGPVDRVEPEKSGAKTERPDAMTTDRPAMGSDQYRDLVQKFCYFTSGSGKGTTSPQNNGTPPSPSPQQKTAPNVDGSNDNYSASSSSSSSGTSSPVHELQAAYTPAQSSFISRSASPATATGQDMSVRSVSPVSFGYPYHSHRDGYLSDTPTPTAIRG